MKKLKTFAAILVVLSLFSFRNIDEKDIKGIWKGNYIKAGRATATMIIFKKGNHAEWYSAKANGLQKITGAYAFNAANELTVSFSLPGNASSITMTGKWDPSRNLFTGEWQNTINENGSFSFERQNMEGDENIISVGMETAGN